MKVIDSQSHWYPRALWEAYLDNPSYPRCRMDGARYAFELAPGRWFPIPDHFLELELQLEEMDAAGIDVVVSSSASFGETDGLPGPKAKEVAVALNQARAAAEKEYRGRFYGLATIPWQDTEAALEVLEDAVGRLGLRGVLIHSNIAGEPIDSERCIPIYERLDELEIPLFIHPARTIMEEKLRRYGLEYILGYMFDTSIAALSLVLAGIVQRFPGLKVVHPHAGATLPYLAGRIDSSYSKPYALNTTFPKPPSDYLASFYTDTMCQSPAALRLGKEFYGVDRLMFGSDYPYFAPAEALAFVRSNIPEAEAEKVLFANAARLLRLDTT